MPSAPAPTYPTTNITPGAGGDGGGEGVTVHNQLSGRTTAGAHPATAISKAASGARRVTPSGNTVDAWLAALDEAGVMHVDLIADNVTESEDPTSIDVLTRSGIDDTVTFDIADIADGTMVLVRNLSPAILYSVDSGHLVESDTRGGDGIYIAGGITGGPLAGARGVICVVTNGYSDIIAPPANGGAGGPVAASDVSVDNDSFPVWWGDPYYGNQQTIDEQLTWFAASKNGHVDLRGINGPRHSVTASVTGRETFTVPDCAADTDYSIFSVFDETIDLNVTDQWTPGPSWNQFTGNVESGHYYRIEAQGEAD